MAIPPRPRASAVRIKGGADKTHGAASPLPHPSDRPQGSIGIGIKIFLSDLIHLFTGAAVGYEEGGDQDGGDEAAWCGAKGLQDPVMSNSSTVSGWHCPGWSL